MESKAGNPAHRRDIPLLSTIACVLSVLMVDNQDPAAPETQFKNAMLALVQETYLLTSPYPELAVVIFTERLHEIGFVHCYRPQKARSPCPCVPKKPV
ncbi:MAG: hypothetical protein ACRESZ_09290 [Methylococcales bacterium]